MQQQFRVRERSCVHMKEIFDCGYQWELSMELMVKIDSSPLWISNTSVFFLITEVIVFGTNCWTDLKEH